MKLFVIIAASSVGLAPLATSNPFFSQAIYNLFTDQHCSPKNEIFQGQNFLLFPALNSCVNTPQVFGSIGAQLLSVNAPGIECDARQCFIEVYNQAGCTGSNGPNTFGPLIQPSQNTPASATCYTVTNPVTHAVRGGRSIKLIKKA